MSRTIIEKLADAQMDDYAEAYTFTRLDSVRTYTSYHRAIVYGGVTYAPTVIKRGSYQRKLTSAPATMTITAPIADVLDMFKQGTPVMPVTVQVEKVLVSSPDSGSLLLFKGSIISTTLKGQMATATCRSIGEELRRTIPSVTYQAFCNNNLFDTQCALRKADYRMTVTAFRYLPGHDDGRGIFITRKGFDSFGERCDDKPWTYFSGGIAIHGSEYRTIIESYAIFFTRWIVLHYPFSDLTIGDELVLYPGCDKDPQTCVNSFNNLENFVGFPYIPTLSPLKWGIKVDED